MSILSPAKPICMEYTVSIRRLNMKKETLTREKFVQL